MLYKENVLPRFNVPYIPFSRLKRVDLDEKNLSEFTDNEIWEAFKKGKEAAFIHIYKNYYQMLLDHGCKYATDREMVRDCLQDFFLYLKKNRLGFGPTNSIKLYLLKSFGRRVIEYMNRHKRLYAEKEPCEYTQLGVETCIESLFINKQVKEEQLEKLNKAITALDGIEQKVIYYFYFRGLSYEQIAGIFNFSHVSSARRVMYRSIRKLRCFF